jgi:hypothetical protein
LVGERIGGRAHVASDAKPRNRPKDRNTLLARIHRSAT